MRSLIVLAVLLPLAHAQTRVDETFFLSTPAPPVGRFRNIPPLDPVAVGADAAGAIVFAGRAHGAGIPVTPGASGYTVDSCPTSLGLTSACSDLYLARFLPDGQGPAYMTYLGGAGDQYVIDAAVAGDGIAYVLGRGSLGWTPLAADLDPEAGAESRYFVLAVGPSGDPRRLVALPAHEAYAAIQVDPSSAVYLAGTTHSGVDAVNGFGNEGQETSLYRSADGGNVWTAQATEAPPVVEKLRAVAWHGSTQLYAYGADGLFVSDDLGQSWRLLVPPLDPQPTSFEVAPGIEPTIFLHGNVSQMYRWRDGALTPLFRGYSISVSESDPNLVRAASFDGVGTSRDGGLTWQTAPYPAGYPFADAIWQHPREAETVYLQAYRDGGHGRVLLRSADGSANWTRIDEPMRALVDTSIDTIFEILDLEISPDGSLFAATTVGLFRTSDGGLSWSAPHESFPGAEDPPRVVWEVEVDPSDPQRVVAAATERNSNLPPRRDSRLFHSSDGGGTWSASAQPPRAFGAAVAADPLQAGVFHALGGFRHPKAFVLKLRPSLDAIEYFSIYGGGDGDRATALAVDASGRLFLAGVTSSPDIPGAAGGVQSELPGIASAFVARVASDGSNIERATYFGGTSFEEARAIALGPDGSVHLRGYTSVAGLPLVNPARTDTDPPSANRTEFLAKLNPELTEVVYCTLLGSFNSEHAGLAVDSLGRAIVNRRTAGFDRQPTNPDFETRFVEQAAAEFYSPAGEIEDVLFFEDVSAVALDDEGSLIVAGVGEDGVVPGRRARRLVQGFRVPLESAYVTRLAADQASPRIAAILNAASFRSGPAAPGELVTLFGAGLGPETGVSFVLEDGKLPRTLGGVQVLVDGEPAPLLFANNGQINVASPFSLEVGDFVSFEVRRNGAGSSRIWQRVSAADAGVFTVSGTRRSDAAVLNQDGTVNTPFNPAEPGSIVSIYATGGGKLSPPLAADEVAGLPLSIVPSQVRVEFALNGRKALYAGSAPGLIAGVLQVNVVVPRVDSNLTVVDVKLEIEGVLSEPIQAFVSIAGAPFE